MAGRSGRVQVYPWEKWFERKRALVIPRSKYTAQPGSMAVMIRQKAKDFGKRVSVRINDDASITMKVIGERE